MSIILRGFGTNSNLITQGLGVFDNSNTNVTATGVSCTIDVSSVKITTTTTQDKKGGGGYNVKTKKSKNKKIEIKATGLKAFAKLNSINIEIAAEKGEKNIVLSLISNLDNILKQEKISNEHKEIFEILKTLDNFLPKK